jgi:hypothetical protein
MNCIATPSDGKKVGRADSLSPNSHVHFALTLDETRATSPLREQ